MTTLTARQEEYRRYLESDDWADKRHQTFKIKKSGCWVCRYNNKGVQVHHIKYRNWTDVRPKRDLIPLCPECHKDIHDILRTGESFPGGMYYPRWKLIYLVFRLHRNRGTQLDPSRWRRMRILLKGFAQGERIKLNKSVMRTARRGTLCSLDTWLRREFIAESFPATLTGKCVEEKEQKENL